MRVLNAFFCALIGLSLTYSALAEELWVSNKPFKGQVQGSGSSMKVELEPLLAALRLDAKVSQGRVVFGDFSVPIETSPDGKQLVLLNDIVTGAGLTLKRNASLGTVDLYTPKAGTGVKEEWELDAPSGGRAFSKANYSIKIPQGLQLNSDPKTMQVLGQVAGQMTGNADFQRSARIDFVLEAKGVSEDAVLLLMRMVGLPPMDQLPPGTERKVVDNISQGLAQKGRLTSPPSKTRIGGRVFYKFQHEEGDERKETYIFLDTPRGEFYVTTFGDKRETFARSAPLFRKAVKSLRIK